MTWILWIVAGLMILSLGTSIYKFGYDTPSDAAGRWGYAVAWAVWGFALWAIIAIGIYGVGT